MTNIAAIDIGSNALRAVIARISDSGITLLKNYRVPLRLGQEVFQNNGIISAKKIKATENAFLQIVNLLNDFDVTQTKACATSALRDAKNAQTLIRRIKKNSGIAIKIINGIQEAKLIYKAVNAKLI